MGGRFPSRTGHTRLTAADAIAGKHVLAAGSPSGRTPRATARARVSADPNLPGRNAPTGREMRGSAMTALAGPIRGPISAAHTDGFGCRTAGSGSGQRHESTAAFRARPASASGHTPCEWEFRRSGSGTEAGGLVWSGQVSSPGCSRQRMTRGSAGSRLYASPSRGPPA